MSSLLCKIVAASKGQHLDLRSSSCTLIYTWQFVCFYSYYPLYPPSEDVNADLEHFEEGVKMSVMPHVLISPSDLRYFIKVSCILIQLFDPYSIRPHITTMVDWA